MTFGSVKFIKATIVKTLKCATTGKCFSLVFLTQFTYLFDGSRPYYNTFAVILVNCAYSFWLRRQWHLTIALLAVSSVIFRCDTTVFAFALVMVDLVRARLPIAKCFVWGAASSVASIVVTVTVDSYFWQQLAWPELDVLYFNTVLNKSHEWGVHPWYAYFVEIVPLNITIAYPLAFVALFYKTHGAPVDCKVLELLAPALLFIGLYSMLPHKEYRFVFPAFSMFNVCAAIGIKKMLEHRPRTKLKRRAML